MLKFVSGWAGFPALFPQISERYPFYLPFVTHSENEIAKALDEGGEILAGWSTGAHIILKNIDRITDKYEKIFLFAPFVSFCDYFHSQAIMLMIKKMKRDPRTVLNDFYDKCGLNGFTPETDEKTVTALIEGLEFLLESRADVKGCSAENKVVLVQGAGDMIVNFRASEDVADMLRGEKLITIESGHYMREKLIAEIIYENTHKKIL
ncbi:alpha/beta hydrolase [Geovibrio thiophilus]|uniref:Alpha/beta hydrolase n=1 Tax=Geovibrio thiophilus TaxID=139438 RepID=A0A3R5YZ09_9BACT|nr:alpha/beta hydrolase [Geovibrio thiophilus]QAR32946.1 alpha/beta hydrolase [Geovibrio thiophilus]